MQDGQLLFSPQADLGDPDTVWFERLLAETPWREESITVYGKTHKQPRLMAWYGDPSARYTYSGLTSVPLPWSDSLLTLKERVETISDARFNSVLLNLYRNERDSMGLHADDEPELGPEPTIASLSLGEERTLYFQHNRRGAAKNINLKLPSGSLLLMRGATQANWKHGIRKLSRACGPRINLTFRWIYQ